MMRRLPALLAAPALLAQAPAPQTLGQRLFAEGPAIEKLLENLEPREAYARAQTLIPTEIPPYDKTNLQTIRKSFNHLRDLARTYHLVGRTAFAAGHWEKSLDYFVKAKEISVKNLEEAKPIFNQAKEGFARLALEAKAKLDGNGEYIKSLKAKTEHDAEEKKQLEQVKGWEKDLADNESFSNIFLKDLDIADKDIKFYDSLPGGIQQYLKQEQDQLEAYKFKNDKEKWVEGVMASPNYMEAYTEKRDKVQLLYRMNVLSPDNKKVLRAIEVLQGKAPEPKPAKPAPKKKG